jgi:ribosome-associated protein
MVSENFSRECALAAAKAADERKAFDIMVIEVGQLTDVTDYFVIVTARNNPQVEAILDNVEEVLREQKGVKPVHREGTRDRSWELLDYGDFVVDVFQPEARDYYRLETLWGDAPVVDLAEAGIEAPQYSDRIAKLVGNLDALKEEAE